VRQVAARGPLVLTLKRLSCSTRLMAASSPEGDSLVWKTTPKDPLPTILHWVYCISLVSPVRPSWTFSRMTSAVLVSTGHGTARRAKRGSTYLPFSSLKRPMAGSVTLLGVWAWAAVVVTATARKRVGQRGKVGRAVVGDVLFTAK